MKKLFSVLLSVVMLALLTNPIFASPNVNNKVIYTGIASTLTTYSTHTQEWMKWSNSLTEEEQLQVNYRPAEFTSLNENFISNQETPTGNAESKKFIDPLANFSPDTQEWLKWFNSLPKEVQLQINYRPAEFASLTKSSISFQETPNSPAELKQSSKEPPIVPFAQSMPTGGWEHPYSPSTWANLTDKANCYAYMLNVSTYSGHKLQPGELAGSQFTSLTTSNIYNATLADMPYLGKSISNSSYSEVPGYHQYKVALVISPGYDYHWYRQDSDGGWSHKRGLTAIDYRDASSNFIVDPNTANRNYGDLNYSTWGGYYMVTY
ncbi:hypothetical protein [Paenibacillus sp. IHBB 10380]|uniref:hypothetical protein n=1 Tax=Paenibacillus sp. IHBB 10380 TaxID=1566358 RepID=UPI00069635FD|nr:hypothetical protein [Paenibacillus sp. IHBB 10380]